MSLKRSIFNGFSWTTASSIVITLCHAVKLVLFARVLDETTFGIVTLLLLFSSLIKQFSDVGLSVVIIQDQCITAKEKNTLYWLNVFIGAALATLLFILAPLINMFIEIKNFDILLKSICPIFIFYSIAIQYRVYLQKDMNFKLITPIEIAVELVTTCAIIVFLLLQFQELSLIFGILIHSVLFSFAFTAVGIKKYGFPKIEVDLFATQQKIIAGTYQIGERIINFSSANIDKILITKFLGPNALAIYNIAWQLIIFPVVRLSPILTNVLYPAYCKLAENQKEMNELYLRSILYLVAITLPVYLVIFFYADVVIATLFGDAWIKSTPIVKLLCSVGILKVLGNPGSSLLMANAKFKFGFFWNNIWLCVISISIWLSFKFSASIYNISLGVTYASICMSFVWHFLIQRITGVRYLSISIEVVIVILICIVMLLFVEYVSVAISLPGLISVGCSLLTMYAGVSAYLVINNYRHLK